MTCLTTAMAPLIDIMDCVYTVLHLPDELLGLSHSFLGDGGFGLDSLLQSAKGSILHIWTVSVIRRSRLWKEPPLPFHVQEDI